MWFWIGLILLFCYMELKDTFLKKIPKPTHDEVAWMALASLELIKTYGNDSVKFLCDREMKQFQEILNKTALSKSTKRKLYSKIK